MFSCLCCCTLRVALTLFSLSHSDARRMLVACRLPSLPLKTRRGSGKAFPAKSVYTQIGPRQRVRIRPRVYKEPSRRAAILRERSPGLPLPSFHSIPPGEKRMQKNSARLARCPAGKAKERRDSVPEGTEPETPPDVIARKQCARCARARQVPVSAAFPPVETLPFFPLPRIAEKKLRFCRTNFAKPVAIRCRIC